MWSGKLAWAVARTSITCFCKAKMRSLLEGRDGVPLAC